MASEFYFNLKTATIFQAVKWERNPIFRFAPALKKLFLILFILVSGLFLYLFLFESFIASKLEGAALIFLVFFLTFWLAEVFLNSKLKKPELKATIEEAIAKLGEGDELCSSSRFANARVGDELPSSSRFANARVGDELPSSSRFANARVYNLAEFLSFETAKAIWKSKNNSTALFYNLIQDNPELNFIFARVLLNLNEIKKNLRRYLAKISKEVKPQPEFQTLILDSLKIAQKKGNLRVEVGDILTALAKYDSIFKKILIDSNLKVEDIENLTWWLENLEEKIAEQKKFWEWKNLIKKGSLAKEWAAGYTINLDKFSIDWSEIVKKQHFPETIGHQKEIVEMERILSRRESKNNVLIVGEPGSGRKSMIQALAKKSVLGESLPEINFKKVKQLDLPSLLAQTETIEEVESILDKIFREVVKAGNVILVIDEFHNYVLPAPRPGTIDISGIISSYLALISFQIVAITTFEGLHKNIEQNPSILPLFEKVEVSEISERETLMLLENLTLFLEQKYKKFISYPALRDIINYCGKYLPATPFPEKAINLLDEVMVYLAQTKEKILLPKHVAEIVTEKTRIPVGEIEIKEREILLNLENLIHQRIINQEEAVKEVSAAMRRTRAEVTIRKGPIGCFLFLGPTGVGKTETSKALAEIYFGSEERMIRLDMSEFQNLGDIPRLIGSPGEEGLLTTKVRETPFSLILLDEIEKSHPNILNLFLQVFDEGHLTDGLGRKVDFKNSIIIATSNAGYQVILEALKQKTEWSRVKEKLLDYLFEKAIFRPEFINRFDAVIVYKPLSKENLLAISELMLQKIKKTLSQKDIEFIITEPLKEKITELSYDPTFGAREMNRVIQDKVGNVLAQAILSGELKRGDSVEIDPETFTLIKR